MAQVAVAPNELYDFLSHRINFGANSGDHLHYVDWGEETDNIETIFDDPRDRHRVRRLIRNGQMTYHCNSVLAGNISVEANPWIQPWPDYDLVLAWQIPHDTDHVPELLYHTQNRLLKPHRTALIGELWRQDQFRRGTASYTQELTAEWKQHVDPPRGEYEWQDHVLSWLPSTEGYDADLVVWENNPPPPLSYWNNAAVNIVTETKWLQCNLTEKTYSVMLWARPFIVMGAPGIMQHVEELGYEIPPAFDFAYDADPKIKRRARGLVKQVLAWNDPGELYRANQASAARNQRRVIQATADLKFPPILEDDSIEWVGSADRIRRACFTARQQAKTML